MRGKKIRVVTVAMSMALVVALGGVLVHSQIDAKASKVDTGVVVEQSVGELVNGIEVKINSKVDLYDTNDNVAAEYYETSSGGYVIFDNEDEVVEQSDSTNRYIDKNKKQYYFGPFEYYEKQDNRYRNLTSNEIVEENVMVSAQNNYYDLVALNDYTEIDDIQVATASADIEETGAKKTKRKLDKEWKLKKDTSFVETNTGNNKGHKDWWSGNCGSTAATIVFLYSYWNGETKFVADKYLYDWQAFTDYLITFIEPKHKGSTKEALTKGMNEYMKKRKLSARYDYQTIYSLDQLTGSDNTVYKITKEKIKKNYPTILGVKKFTDIKYEDHWVVGTGIRRYKKNGEYSYFYVVNDGWGNRDVEIAKKYIDSCVYRDKK